MSGLTGFVNIAASNGDFFTNTTDNDLMIYTQCNTQKVLIGISSNVPANITVTSNMISFYNDVSFGNRLAMKGIEIQMSDGSMANLSTNSVQGFSNEFGGNLQIYVNSNSLSNNFRFQASNVEIARLTGVGTLGLGTSNIQATVHVQGPNLSNVNTVVNSSNLLRWYEFEGNGLDSSSSNVGLTLTGSNVSFVSGKYGKAASFSNPSLASGYANTYFSGTCTSNTPVSVACWFNYTVSATSGSWTPTVFTLGGSNIDSAITVNIANGNWLIASIYTGSAGLSNVVASGVQSVSANTWYHVAMTYDGTTCTTYLNGASVGTPVGTVGALSSNILRIGDGGNTTGNSTAFVGHIDDFRVYARTLTAADVMTLYNSTNNVMTGYINVTRGCIGWYQGEGNANDTSGSNYHASNVGYPLYIPGKVGSAVFFPNKAGATQVHSVDVAGYTGLSYQQPLSLAFWANVYAFGAADTCLINLGSSNSDQGLFVNCDNDMNVWLHNGTWNRVASNIAITTRTWYHVAVTYTSGMTLTYVNGALSHSNTTVSGNLTVAAGLRMGGRWGQNLAFNGAMDDVRVYNRVLSATEVSDLYSTTNSGAGNGDSVVTTGMVGVGTPTPQYPLDVVGDINFSGMLRSGGVPYIGSQWSNNAANVFITGSNVGLGKNNPSYPLDVNGDINFSGILRSGGVPYVGSQWSNNSTNVFITGSNVGIGTTAPSASYALDVYGSVRSTSNFIAGISDSSNSPGYTWSNDTNTGMFRVGTGQIGFAAQGSNIFTLCNTTAQFLGDLAMTRTMAFNGVKIGKPNTGASPASVTQIVSSIAGYNYGSLFTSYTLSNNQTDFRFLNTAGTSMLQLTSNAQLQASTTDTSNIPAYTWQDDSNTGMYHVGTGQIGFSSQGSNLVTMSNSQVTISGKLSYTSYAFYFTAASNTVFTNGNTVPFNASNVNYPYTTITANGFQAPVRGVYMINVGLNFDNNGTSSQYRSGIYRSSTLTVTAMPYVNFNTDSNFVGLAMQEMVNSSIFNTSTSSVVYCNAGDYIRVFMTVSSANASLKTYSWGFGNYMSGYLISTL